MDVSSASVFCAKHAEKRPDFTPHFWRNLISSQCCQMNTDKPRSKAWFTPVLKRFEKAALPGRQTPTAGSTHLAVPLRLRLTLVFRLQWNQGHYCYLPSLKFFYQTFIKFVAVINLTQFCPYFSAFLKKNTGTYFNTKRLDMQNFSRSCATWKIATK